MDKNEYGIDEFRECVKGSMEFYEHLSNESLIMQALRMLLCDSYTGQDADKRAIMELLDHRISTNTSEGGA